MKAVLVVLLLAPVTAIPALAGDWHINFRLNNDATTQVQNEEQVVVDPNNPDHVVAVWRDFRLGYREVAFATTFNQWRTVARETLYYAHGSSYLYDSDPGLTVDSSGNFYVVILSFNDTAHPNALYVKKSTDGGLTWGPNATVVDNVSGYFEDKELIACDRTNSPYKGYVYVTWARFGSAEQVMMCRSTNGGVSFSAPLAVSGLGSLQWPVPAIGPNGELYIAWDAYSAIQFSKSTDGGVTFNGTHTIQNVGFGYGYINGSIGTFSYPAIDVDITAGPRRGWVYCVYEDLEQGTTSDSLDMYFTKSTNGGTTWSAPTRINDDTLNNRRDQFHPWMTVDSHGNIHACWLDRRLDPANMFMDCYYSFSTDGGTTWAKNQRVSTVSSDPRLVPKRGRPWRPEMPLADALPSEWLGEYIGIAAADTLHVYPVWTDTRNGNQDAFGARPDNLTGAFEEPGPIGREPALLSLRAFPNPARKGCEIRLGLLSPQPVRLTIYDVQGRLIRSFPTPYPLHPTPSFLWDGKDDSGSEVPSGVYLIRAEVGREKAMGRVVVTR